MSTPACALQQINVQVRRRMLVWLRAEVIGMVIAEMNLLHARPLARIALRRRKSGAPFRPPLGLVARIKGARIERSQGIAADAAFILEDETQFRLIRKV